MDAAKQQIGGGVKPRREQRAAVTRVAVNEGFIRADGDGRTVRIDQILPAHLKTFSTAAQQETVAQQYEHVHGVVVLRAGESERDASVKERVEAMRSQKPAREQPTHGMSKDRRHRQMLKDKQEYNDCRNSDRRAILRKEINDAEQVLELPVTDFAKGGGKPEVQAEEPVSPAVMKKLKLYAEGTKRQQERALEKDTDLEFLKAVKDTESDADLLAITIRRLTEAGEI